MSEAANSSQFVIGHWVVEEEHEHIVWTRFVKNFQRYWGMRSVANASRSLGSTEIIYHRDCPGKNDDTRRENSSEKVVHTVTFGTGDPSRIVSTITDESELSVDAELRGMSLYFTSERPVRFSSFWTVDYSTPQAKHLVSYCVWRPLSGRSWVLSSSIVLEATAGYELIFLKSVFWHRPIDDRSNAGTEPSTCADTSADSPQSRHPATTRPIDQIEKEIDETTFTLNAAEETLATLTSELEDCEAEIFELELNELGINGLPRVFTDRQRYLLEREQELRDYYDQAGHLKDEIATCTSDIEVLKDTLAELETELDDANRDWDSESVELIEQAYGTAAEQPGFQRPRVTKEDVFGERILSRLSAAARKIFETCQWTLLQQSDSAEHRRRYDNSHVIGYMAKCCERMFADAFSEKSDSLSTHPLAQELLRKPKEFQFEIPPKDAKQGITRGNLVRTLDNVQQAITKKKEIEWSGTRNCGIALLLFGSRLRFTNATPCELVNPLGAKGRLEKTTSLRVAMYKLQKIRNGFVHRHVARWSDVEKARIWFEKCVRGMASALYGLRSK